MIKRIVAATNFIRKGIQRTPDLAIILGSGLGGLSKLLEEKVEVNYEDIPGFPTSTVQGHAGKLLFGYLNGIYVVMMQGRFHYYEGHNMEDVTLPIRVFANMNIKHIIITNAAGGIGDHLNPGDIMLINDHLSLFVPSVLRGPNLDRFGPRFPDMTSVYSKRYLDKARKVASDMPFEVKEGVYAYMTGPRYETAADVRALKILGADAVGMSTVPEAIVAKHSGMEVVGISFITNKAAGILAKPLSHNEVLETANVAGENMCQFVHALVPKLFK